MTVIEAELGRRLRLARKAWNLTQGEVAEALGLSRSAVSEMEAGRRGVSGLELHRLAHLYGRDMADFLEEDFEPTATIAALFRRHAKVSLSPCAMESLRRCMALGREDRQPRAEGRPESRAAHVPRVPLHSARNAMGRRAAGLNRGG